ncbi:MAG: hypothetical protein ACK5UY_06905 [Holosporales bacterium]
MAILDSLGTTRSQLWSIEKIEVTKNDDTETFYYLIPENPSTESTVVKLDPNDQSGSTTTYGTLKEELEALREQDNTTVSVDTFSENLRVFQKNGKIYFKNSSGDTIYTLTTNLNDEVTLQEVSDSSSLDDDTSGTLLGSLGSIFNGSDSFGTSGTSGREYSVYELKDDDDNKTVVIVPEDTSSNSTAFIYDPDTRKVKTVSVSTLKNYIKENDLNLDSVLENQRLRKDSKGRIIFVDKDGDATRLVRNIEGDLDPQDLETVGDTTLGRIFDDNDLGGLGEIFDGDSSLAPLVVGVELLGRENIGQQVVGGLLVATSLVGIIQDLTDNNSPNNSTVEEEVRLVSTVTETASTEAPTETPTETASTETTTTADPNNKVKKEAGTGIILLTPEEYEEYLASGGADGSSGNDALPPSVLEENTVGSGPAPAPAQTPAASTPTATPKQNNNNKQTVAAASESKTKKESVAAAPPSGSNIRTQQPIVPPSSPPSTPKEEESITIKGKDVTWKYDETQKENGPLVLKVTKPRDAKYNKDGTSTTGVWTVNRFEKTPTHYTFLVSVFNKDGKVDSYERVNIPLEGMKGKVVRLPDAFKETKYIEKEKSVNVEGKPTVVFLQLDRTESGTYTVKPLTGKAPVPKGDNKYDTNGDGTGDVSSLVLSAQWEKSGETNKDKEDSSSSSETPKQPKKTTSPVEGRMTPSNPLREKFDFFWEVRSPGKKEATLVLMAKDKKDKSANTSKPVDFLVKDGKIYAKVTVTDATGKKKSLAMGLNSDNYNWDIDPNQLKNSGIISPESGSGRGTTVTRTLKVAGGPNTLTFTGNQLKTEYLKPGEYDGNGGGYDGVPKNTDIDNLPFTPNDSKKENMVIASASNLTQALAGTTFGDPPSNTSLNLNTPNALEPPLATVG